MNSSRRKVTERTLFQVGRPAVQVVNLRESWWVWLLRLLAAWLLYTYGQDLVQIVLDKIMEQPQSLQGVVAVMVASSNLTVI